MIIALVVALCFGKLIVTGLLIENARLRKKLKNRP